MNRHKAPAIICPSCIKDKRLSVLDYDTLLSWYFCRVCTFRLEDEKIFRLINTSKA